MNKRSTIVLVEDDTVLGLLLVAFLKENLFKVEWFLNATDALTYFETKTCDLIISDLQLPAIDGAVFYTHIQAMLKKHFIPFIMITAMLDEDVKIKQLELGVNDYIVKPFNFKELIFKINNLLLFKRSIVTFYAPDILSKVTIKLSEKDFITSFNQILLSSIRENLDQQELANLMHMSKSTLDKKIRKYSNKNTSQYIREFKLDYAVRLMQLGEHNMQYIAEQTGFNSLSYFSTSFKIYLGMNPIAYFKDLTAKKEERARTVV